MLEYRDYMKEDEGGGAARSFFGTRTVTQVLLLANLACFVAFIAVAYVILPYVVRVGEHPERIARSILNYVGLVPSRALGDLWLWQLFTYSFLHSAHDLLHLIFNLYALYWLGREVETIYGAARFTALYFLSALAGALAFCMFDYGESQLIGASGAIYGMLVVFALHYPHQKILLIVFPIEAWLMVAIFIGIDLTMHLTGTSGGVGSLAHLGGAAAGFGFYKLQGRVEAALDGFERRASKAERQSVEAIEARLDTLLEKISKDGMDSLSKKEREFLKRASSHYQKKA